MIPGGWSIAGDSARSRKRYVRETFIVGLARNRAEPVSLPISVSEADRLVYLTLSFFPGFPEFVLRPFQPVARILRDISLRLQLLPEEPNLGFPCNRPVL